MLNFTEEIRRAPDFLSGSGAGEEEIAAAAAELGLEFAPEFCEYLKAFRVATSDGHEFTGLVSSARLNVVDVTQKLRAINEAVPHSCYVVEEVQTDGIVIWQDSTGTVYNSMRGCPLEKVAGSLAEYFFRTLSLP